MRKNINFGNLDKFVLKQNMTVRVVASYTTLPGREDVLKTSITSLLNQTRPPDEIYLTIAEKAERLDLEYPEPSDFIKQHCRIIRIPKDHGPATKIYGALQEEKNRKTLIFSCDDDTIYPPTILEKLLEKAQKYPKCAIAGTGAWLRGGKFFMSVFPSIQPFHKMRSFMGPRVGNNGRAADILYGSSGVLYRRGMFEFGEELQKNLWDKVFHDSERTIFHNDDVLFSSYLCWRGIQRRVFPDIPSVNHLSGNDALSSNFFKMHDRMWKAIGEVRKLGYFHQYEDCAIDENPAARTLCILVAIILIILCIVIFWKM